MAKRYHLNTVDQADGTLWLTLVYEDPFAYYVEQYNDSRLSFLKSRLKIIHIEEMDRHEVGGMRLVDLVEQKLRQIESGRPDQTVLIANRRKRFAAGGRRTLANDGDSGQ